MKLKWIASFFASMFLLGHSGPAKAFDVTVALSSDLRGAVQLVEDLYQDEDSSAGGSEASSSAIGNQGSPDTVNFAVQPALHFEVAQPVFQRRKFIFGLKGEVSYVSLGVRYPNGLSFESGGRRIRFTESVSINLRSLDAGIGSFVSFDFSPHASIGGEFMYVYQMLNIKSNFGSWELIDDLIDRRVDTSVWLDYRFFNRIFELPVQPELRFGVARRNSEALINVGLRLSF